jgi:hypothetical protein
VAVIDQGVDTKHADLKGRLLPSYNVVNPINQGDSIKVRDINGNSTLSPYTLTVKYQ